MKNLFIAGAIILILLNTLAGFLITNYLPFNYFMVDVCLLFSTVLIYLFSRSNVSAGFKIGLSVLFSFTGLIKVICCASAPTHFIDNFFIVTVLGICSFEIVCLLSAFAMKKFV